MATKAAPLAETVEDASASVAVLADPVNTPGTVPGAAGWPTADQDKFYRCGPLKIRVPGGALSLEGKRAVVITCAPDATSVIVNGRESSDIIAVTPGAATTVDLVPGLYNIAAYYVGTPGAVFPVDSESASVISGAVGAVTGTGVAVQTIPALRITPKTMYTQTIQVGA